MVSKFPGSCALALSTCPEGNADSEIYLAVLFGIPTRYGNFPAQMKAFFDSTGSQWQQGSFWGKYAGLFVSTAGLGGGQESTCIAAMSTLVHHGMIFVPLGYKTTFAQLTNLDEVHGGSPWGAGTFAVRFPSTCIYCAFLRDQADWFTSRRAPMVPANLPLSRSRSPPLRARPFSRPSTKLMVGIDYMAAEMLRLHRRRKLINPRTRHWGAVRPRSLK